MEFTSMYSVCSTILMVQFLINNNFVHSQYITPSNHNMDTTLAPPPSLSSQHQSIDTQDGIDRLQTVEATPTQMVITTTKEGPLEQLKINIEVTDLDENRVLPPVALSGLWLLISRGRYTVPFLKPDHWYGINFHSENVVNQRPISHQETKLVKTPPRPGQNETRASLEPKFEINIYRNDDMDHDNAEGVFLTAKWLDKKRMNNSMLIVDVTVQCEHSDTNEQIVLHDNEDGITIEIAMDHRLEVEDVNVTSHQIKAQITPLKCRKICWKSTYFLQSNARNFSIPHELVCKEIDGTTSTTFLRDIKYHTVDNNELIVETEMLSKERDDGFVTLSAVDVTEPDNEMIYKTFSTSNSNGRFNLPLEDNKVYAVQYEYTKTKPFRYTTHERFLVETTHASNATNATVPTLLAVAYEPSSFKRPKQGEFPQHPKITVSLGPEYENHTVIVHVEPFCSQNQSSEILLNDRNKTFDLQVPLQDAICAQNDAIWFCEKKNYTECSSVLCYTPVIVLDQDFEGSTKCINVLEHFDMKAAGSTVFSGWTFYSVFALFYFIRRLC